MTHQKPKEPAHSVDLKKVALISFLVFVIFGIAGIVYVMHSQPKMPDGLIVKSDVIADYDKEFSNFIGPGHKVAEYSYLVTQPSKNLEFGCGPLYDTAGFQTIIGQTGSVGAIAYGVYRNGEWDMQPGPKGSDQTFILVFPGCIAPQEWWNRPVLASALYCVSFSDGRFMQELPVWVPWPEDLDFDDPPNSATICATSWYWNGYAYVKTYPDQPPETVVWPPPSLSKGPARGLSPSLRARVYVIMKKCYARSVYKRKFYFLGDASRIIVLLYDIMGL